MNTHYIDLSPITKIQTSIMTFVIKWVHEEKIPVPQREIYNEMTRQGVSENTVKGALKSLLIQGYIRKAISSSQLNRTSYVQLRGI